ncbi:IS630 family transposase [Beijerinckia indica]|uniref:IS630 family transposase n=1 Tax=Beijerinckia indica TaxID=533 RepID=UPI0018B11414|nr:IS630 family transposase [Beijerinckia indica]
MPAPLSLDLRRRFQRLIEEGLSAREAAQRLMISAATGARLALKVRRGESLAAVKCGCPTGRGKLEPYKSFLIELVTQDPDITLFELRDALAHAEGVQVHYSAISRALKRLGFTYKKALVADEQRRTDIVEARADWTERRQPFMQQRPERLVFIDETCVKTNLTRIRGRARRGQRLHGTAPFGKWHTQTFIAGLTGNALIAPWVIDGAMNGAAFDIYIETQLAPLLAPGTVVILDNLSTHRSPRAAEALKAKGCWFLFLPAYSPDLNPIEMAFAKLKAHLRRIGARTFDQLCQALADICDLFTPQECWNFFKHAGYVST